ncbi:hypothetical protein P5624_04125 [Bacillus subtilis]|uniref:hypothetical protein n=1 Tax=Bacillus subtilis TaxID=1423 RepID=UPI0013D5F651|nr:hypothetical protein [Bacillus subtilis]WEY93187.1 hypothetical protein P5624_04125 [Bacillus subtilis]
MTVISFLSFGNRAGFRTNDRHAARCQWIGGTTLPIAVRWILDESPVQPAF